MSAMSLHPPPTMLVPVCATGEAPATPHATLRTRIPQVAGEKKLVKHTNRARNCSMIILMSISRFWTPTVGFSRRKVG